MEDVQAAEKAGRVPPEDRLQLLANVASKSTERGPTSVRSSDSSRTTRRRNTGPTCCAGSNPSPVYNNRLDTRHLSAAARDEDGGHRQRLHEMAHSRCRSARRPKRRRSSTRASRSALLGQGRGRRTAETAAALATQRADETPKQLATAETERATEGRRRPGPHRHGVLRHGPARQGCPADPAGHRAAAAGRKARKGRPDVSTRPTCTSASPTCAPGQKQKAVQAFKSVQGTDGSADLARLWTRVG